MTTTTASASWSGWKTIRKNVLIRRGSTGSANSTNSNGLDTDFDFDKDYGYRKEILEYCPSCYKAKSFFNKSFAERDAWGSFLNAEPEYGDTWEGCYPGWFGEFGLADVDGETADECKSQLKIIEFRHAVYLVKLAKRLDQIRGRRPGGYPGTV